MKKGILLSYIFLLFFSLWAYSQSSISGLVYQDVNNDGAFQDGLDQRLEGLQLILVQGSDLIDFIESDDQGRYQFDGLEPGQYAVVFDPLPPDQFVFPQRYDLDLGPAQELSGNDFRIVSFDNFARVSGAVFYDLNGNGQQDNLEPGIGGLELSLTGPEILNLTTQSNGSYTSGYVTPGDYELMLNSLPPNSQLTSPDSYTFALPAGTDTIAQAFTLQPALPFSIVTGAVCYDFDADGMNDPSSEPGIHQVLVEVYDSGGALVFSTMTNPDGSFSTSTLAPGTYTITVPTIPEGTTPTTPTTYTIMVTPKMSVDPILFYFDTTEPLFKCGMAVATCFSGINTNFPANPNGDVIAGFDIRNHGAQFTGTDWGTVTTLHHPQWIADSLGEVFGIAIDADYNVYVASSTVYGPNQGFGNLGAPGIHKIDAFTGAVSNLVAEGSFVVGNNTIPNLGAGFGNICYDRDHDQLFATNWSDGMIYRIAMDGTVQSRFDPITISNGLDPSDPDSIYVRLEERPWAVAYNHTDSKLYFSIWNEDSGRPNDTLVNEIYSISLDGTGEFMGTTGGSTITGNDSLEICLVEIFNAVITTCMDTVRCADTILCNATQPVSDLAFSEAGLMLVAERTMSGNHVVFPLSSGWAHRSKVLEYENTGTSWQLTTGHTPPYDNLNDLKFRIGSSRRNAAGGGDYGYESFDPTDVDVPECDNTVWSSGDALAPGSSPRIYGIQGMPATGGMASNSVLIDLDQNVIINDKALLADVEIFKCGCPIPCDNVTDAGTIGYDQLICGPGADPDPIIGLTMPSGGTGAIEYLWLVYTESNPVWTPIPGSNTPDYDPGPVFEKTYFLRCARRENCGTYLESNIVMVEVDDIAVAAIEGPVLVCQGDVVTFYSTGSSDGATYMWEFGPGVVPATAVGETATVTFVSFGSYEVTLTVTKNGCTSTAIHDITVTLGSPFCDGLIDNNTVDQLMIFPNPSNSQIRLRLPPTVEQGVSYQIMNNLGERLGHGRLQEGTNTWMLDIEALPFGVHIIEVKTHDGKRYTEKLIKQ